MELNEELKGGGLLSANVFFWEVNVWVIEWRRVKSDWWRTTL